VNVLEKKQHDRKCHKSAKQNKKEKAISGWCAAAGVA